MRRVLFLLTLAWGTLAFSQGTFENTAKAKIITRFTQFRSHKPGQNTGVDSIGNLDQADSATVTSAAVNVAPTYVQTIGADGRTTKTATALSGFAFGLFSGYGIVGAGGNYPLTNSATTAISFSGAGGVSPSVTLTAIGTYVFYVTGVIHYAGYAFGSANTVNIRIRRTTNTGLDLQYAIFTVNVPIVGSPITGTAYVMSFPVITWSQLNASDTYVVTGQLMTTAGITGAVQISACSIVAIRLY